MDFVVGDEVKVICIHPSHGWGSVSRGQIGTVRRVYPDFIAVDFVKQRAWNGIPSEFELVTPVKDGPNRELKKPETEW